MATFTALEKKLFSMNFFCNTKVAGLAEILSSGNFHIYGTYLFAVKLHTNGRYNCGEFALVDEDFFAWNHCPKETIHDHPVPGVIRIMAPMDSRKLQGMLMMARMHDY